MIKLTLIFLSETLNTLDTLNELSDAIYSLRAINVYVQGSNEANMQTIIENGFISVAGVIMVIHAYIHF